MNKNKWIILISVIVALVLAAVLLIVMLGDSMPGNKPAGNDDDDILGTYVIVDTTGSTPTEPSAPTQSTDKELTGPEDTEIEVDVDMGEDETEDDMVIDFDDLLAAAGA